MVSTAMLRLKHDFGTVVGVLELSDYCVISIAGVIGGKWMLWSIKVEYAD